MCLEVILLSGCCVTEAQPGRIQPLPPPLPPPVEEPEGEPSL